MVRRLGRCVDGDSELIGAQSSGEILSRTCLGPLELEPEMEKVRRPHRKEGRDSFFYFSV